MIGPWQHRVHMRSSFTSMSAAVRSLERAGHIWKVATVFPKVARFVARRFQKKKIYIYI